MTPHAGRCYFVPVRDSQVIPGGVVCRCRCGRIRVRPPADYLTRKGA